VARIVVVALAFATLTATLDLFVPTLPTRGTGPVAPLMALLSGICPQRALHSYTLGGVQLPIEARMFGMFAGLLAGAVELVTVGRARIAQWPRLSVRLVLLVGFTMMVFDGFNALFYDLGLPHAYAPDLRLRLATGVLAGLAMAYALVPSLALVLPHMSQAPLFTAAAPSWRDVAVAVALAGGTALLLASGWGPLLYVLSLIAAAGVLTALALINRVFLGVITLGWRWASSMSAPVARREWMTGALTVSIAVAELAALAVVRGLALPGA